MNIWLKRGLIGLLVCFAGLVSLAQDQQPDPAAAMQEWMKNMMPGDMHKMLASFDGKWNAEMTVWESPDAPPTKSMMKAENKMIMGGRYQIGTMEGTMMEMPFNGMSTTGFDNASGTFKSTWIDNMGTSIAMSEGTYDADSDSITMTGEMYYPGMGDVKFKSVLKKENEDKHTFTMYMVMGEQDVKTMEIVYTRAE